MSTVIKHVLLAALGGAIGSALRYSTVALTNRYHQYGAFPYGTLAVNVIGCFLIAWIGTLAAEKITLNAEVRLFIFTGILGGFTTFSAFGYETFYLFRTSHLHLAFLNILSNLFLGLGAVWLGYLIAKM